MQNTCSNCSTPLDPDAVFCPFCGTSVSANRILNCPKCGKSISAAAKFCKYCAFDLTQLSQSTLAPASTIITTRPAASVTNEAEDEKLISTPAKTPPKFLRLMGQESPALLPIFIWGLIGGVSGLISYYFKVIPIIGDYGPGIVFGIVIYLFGEYSSSPPIGRRKGIYSFIVVIAASTIGWYLALSIAINWGPDPALGFLVAGITGSACIVSAELLCWRFKFQNWIYAICVLIVAGSSGYMIFHLIGVQALGIYVIWQTCVLTIHAIAFGTSKKWLIISTAVFVLLAGGISITMALQARATAERVEKERVQAEKERVQEEAKNEKAARERAEEDKRALQRDKEDAEKRAEEERKSREAAESREQAGAYITQVSRQLDFAGGYFVSNGFTKTHDYKIDMLPNSGTASFTLTLLSGWQYNLISTCDKDCSDIDIYVYDGYGNQIASNTDRDDKPVVTVNVYRGGEFRIKVVMYKCNSSPCVYGVGAFGKG